MKAIKMLLESCKDCPYLWFDENRGCSNSRGWSMCGKMNRPIERDVVHPDFPSFCPLENVDEQH